jgi:hypothetical protein
MAGTVDNTSGMTPSEANNARSGYRIRLRDGKWHDVPNFALIDPKTNKLGSSKGLVVRFDEREAACGMSLPTLERLQRKDRLD